MPSRRKLTVLTAAKPTSARVVRAIGDLKNILIRVGETGTQATLLASGVTTDPSALFAALFSILDVKQKLTTEELAWRLVIRATGRAICEIYVDYISLNPDFGLLDSARIENIMSIEHFELPDDFLSAPHNIEVIQNIIKVFSNHLTDHGYSPHNAEIIARRLENYFPHSLYEEWRDNSAYYEPLSALIQNPFSESAKFSLELNAYRSELKKQLYHSMFGEKISLNDIYVPLRAYYTTHIDTENRESRIVVNLDIKVKDWINNTDNSESIFLVKGGPGSGKSSFLKKLAHDLIEEDKTHVFHFPLQRFLLNAQLIDAIGKYLFNSSYFKRNPLSDSYFLDGSRKIVLLFDGLDELTKPGEISDIEAKRFLMELRTTLLQFNVTRQRVIAVVTGRTAILQSTADAVRVKAESEVMVLPLFIAEYHRDIYEDPLGLLNADQRLAWWQKYSRMYPEEGEKIPPLLLEHDLTDLSAEPLLIYLLILSGYHKENIDPHTLNRNSVYERLFHGVRDRKYDHEPVAIRQALENAFDEVMETIATAAWYGDGRTATLSDIKALCSDRIKLAIDKVASKDGGVHRLIAAFYFQASDAKRGSDNETIEFTHKSFGEYLTARRIVREIKTTHEGFQLGSDFFSESTALSKWFKLCGNQPMTHEIARFITDELEMPSWSDTTEAWKGSLERLFRYTLAIGISPSWGHFNSIRDLERSVRNMEEAILVSLSGTARSCGKLADLNGNGDELSAFISRVGGYHDRNGWIQDRVYKLALAFLKVGETIITCADLAGSDFSKTSMEDSLFFNIDLRGCTFKSAKLIGSSFKSSEVGGCNFENADLESADFSQVTQDARNLAWSQHRGVNFSAANLRGADLRCADLRYSLFHNADMTGADLRGAQLQGASFKGAHLDGVKLQFAYMHGVRTSGKEFKNCDLKDVDRSRKGDQDIKILRRRPIPSTKKKPVE